MGGLKEIKKYIYINRKIIKFRNLSLSFPLIFIIAVLRAYLLPLLCSPAENTFSGYLGHPVFVAFTNISLQLVFIKEIIKISCSQQVKKRKAKVPLSIYFFYGKFASKLDVSEEDFCKESWGALGTGEGSPLCISKDIEGKKNIHLQGVPKSIINAASRLTLTMNTECQGVEPIQQRRKQKQ